MKNEESSKKKKVKQPLQAESIVKILEKYIQLRKIDQNKSISQEKVLVHFAQVTESPSSKSIFITMYISKINTKLRKEFKKILFVSQTEFLKTIYTTYNRI